MTTSVVEQKILKAAQNTFLRYGFHGTTLQKIAVMAEVNKSIIHYYFRSKEKLYVRILENILDCNENADFTNNNFQEKYLKVKWFLFTELYNNRNLFEKSLKKLYPKNWDKKLDDIKKLLKFSDDF